MTSEGRTGRRKKRREAGAGKDSLAGRYRAILVEKLTPGDLAELQSYLEKEKDRDGNLDPGYREKFEWKLRQFLHEEVLTREIVGIEVLVRELRPSDLKR